MLSLLLCLTLAQPTTDLTLTGSGALIFSAGSLLGAAQVYAETNTFGTALDYIPIVGPIATGFGGPNPNETTKLLGITEAAMQLTGLAMVLLSLALPTPLEWRPIESIAVRFTPGGITVQSVAPQVVRNTE